MRPSCGEAYDGRVHLSLRLVVSWDRNRNTEHKQEEEHLVPMGVLCAGFSIVGAADEEKTFVENPAAQVAKLGLELIPANKKPLGRGQKG